MAVVVPAVVVDDDIRMTMMMILVGVKSSVLVYGIKVVFHMLVLV